MIDHKITAAIVDYGLGNLFSVKHACEHVGILAVITASPADLFAADLVILPGVGAFGDAMTALSRLDLVVPLKEISASGKWLVGICLGLQLLMSESYEFGVHKGLDILEGAVVPLENLDRTDAVDGISRWLKVPQVGWNQIQQPRDESSIASKSWDLTPLEDTPDGEYMYFVHSYYVKPARRELVTSTTLYGQVEFCSSMQYNNIFACQFHPERSGVQGLKVYQNIVRLVKKRLEKCE